MHAITVTLEETQPLGSIEKSAHAGEMLEVSKQTRARVKLLRHKTCRQCSRAVFCNPSPPPPHGEAESPPQRRIAWKTTARSFGYKIHHREVMKRESHNQNVRVKRKRGNK